MTMRVHGRNVLLAGGLALAFAVTHSRDAEACGCFTPPDPSVPIVQAGERILFSMENGIVTANIQIQYAGNAQDFGWLLPLPSVPAPLELGTDELFASLISTTQPKYRLQQRFEGACGFGGPNFGGFPSSAGGTGSGGAGPPLDGAGRSVVVIEDSIGPYDYAVLRADSKDEMLAWMAENRYFVPAGTDQTVMAYIRPNAYFLALKLRSGQSAGDLQPVVVKYESTIPMIPIVLTSVAAQPNMGIQVWMLGEGRAIPRNYFHTIINDLAIDWATSGQNYNDVIIGAVGEAPGKHSFVTEYAGTSGIMRNVLNYPGRFGTAAELAASPDPASFVANLQRLGYPFTSQLLAIVGRYIPYPTGLAAQGITAANFYQSYSYYTGAFRTQYPDLFVGWQVDYQPQAMADELQLRVVKPTLDVAGLFDKYSRLTRLYTTLSPEDMNLDPTFDFNPGLPDVAKDHDATLTFYCGSGSTNRATTPARLVTEQGWVRNFAAGTGPVTLPPPPAVPFTRRLEMLRIEGGPEIVMDNPPSGGCGCATGGAGPGSQQLAAGGAFAFAFALTALRARRRRRPRA